MVDEGENATAPASSDRPEKRCERCGSAIDTSDWYPVTNERGEDGSIRLYHFCSDGCQDAWLDGRSD